jgi:hypothetical protein
LRDIARRAFPLSRGSRIVASMVVVVAFTALAFISSGPAEAAAVPPTVASAFTPTEIGVGDSTATALSVTITNPNTTGTLSAVSFTDTLPAGLTVDDPAGENGTCGSAGVITATPGSSTISLTGGSVKATAAGTASCTISVAVIASQTGVFTNSTGLVSSSAGSSAAASTASVTVLPPPTLTVANIKNNAKYTFGQTVKPTYTCSQAGDPTQLVDCSASDDLGNSIASGQALKTRIPGVHSLTVTATSADGLSTSDTFNYTVLPNNRFSEYAVQTASAGVVSFDLGLPGAGTIKAVEVGPKHVAFGTFTATVGQKRTLKVTVRPTPAGKKLLVAPVSTKQTSSTKTTKAKKAAPVRVKITLTVTYTPTGGAKKTVTKHIVAVSSK